MEDKNLIIGFDLGDRYSKICWYNQRKNETENVCMMDQESASQIPTVLYKLDDETWLCGQAAIDMANDYNKGPLIQHFVKDYDIQEEIVVGGETYEKKQLISIFIQTALKLLNRYFEDYAISYMTVTLDEVSKGMMSDITTSAMMWGLGEDAIRVQSHIASLENYVMNQKKELWQHDVGVFEYDEEGMNYYHLSIKHGRHPMIITAQAIPLKMYMNGHMLSKLSPVDLDRQFVEVLGQVLTQKIISSIFLTGRGFKGEWLNLSLKKMCAPSRRVFLEDNIYAAGACYSGKMDLEGANFKQFIAMNEDIVPFGLYIRGSQSKEIVRKELVAGGSCWYNIDRTEYMILDGTDTVTLHVKDFISNAEKMIPIKLEGLPDRPDKTVMISVHIGFDSSDICTVYVEDKGFGGIFPSSRRSWRKRINVTEYESDKNYVETGRLLFQKVKSGNAPYAFNLSHTRVYSMEELCYYIYNNVYTISMDNFGEELLYWIEKTMEEPNLARGLNNLKSGKNPLKSMIMLVMNYVDYYNSEDCTKLSYILDEIQRQDPLETGKIQADNMVNYCRYMEAIFKYNSVAGQMELPEHSSITRQFKSRVYHNLACAYMRVMNFNAAAINYKKAYELERQEESLKCYLWALKMAGNDSAFFDATEDYGLSGTYVAKVLKEYDDTKQGMVMGQQPDDDEAIRVLKRLKEVYRS